MAEKNANSDLYDEAVLAMLLLLRFSESVKAEAFSRLRLLEKKLGALIQTFDPTSPTRRDSQLKQLRLLTKEANKEIKKTMAFIQKKNKKSYLGYGSIESRRAINALNKTIGFKYLDKRFTKKQIEEITDKTLIDGKTIDEVFKDQTIAMEKRFKAEATDYLAEYQLAGRTGSEASGILDRMKVLGGMLVFSKKAIDSISQTTITATAQDVRRSANDQASDIILYHEWISILDGATTPGCRIRAGKLYDENYRPVGHKVPFGSGPPRHWRCRATISIILKPIEELDKVDKRFSSLPQKQRVAFGGQVPQDTTFNGWLKTRPETEQMEILGKKRWVLWKNNNLSVSDMVNQADRQITLVELEKLIKSGVIGSK